MKSKMMFKKLSLLLVFTLLFTAFGPVLAQDSGTAGEIDVLLRWYYRPEPRPDVAAELESIAAAYMEMNPDATINLVADFPDTGSYAWLAARMAAGEAPDIVWDHWFNRNRILDTWWAPLDEFFEGPNHYIPEGIPGRERWADSFPPNVMQTTRAPDGHWYQVSLDWVETAMFYNIAMFEEADVAPGLDQLGRFHRRYGDQIQDTLGEEAFGSFMPGTGWSTWYWADSVWLSAVWADNASELYMDHYSALQPDLPWRQLNAEDYTKAIHDGVLNAYDPRMDDYLSISKDFAEILPIDLMGISLLGDVLRMWLGEQTAIHLGLAPGPITRSLTSAIL